MDSTNQSLALLYMTLGQQDVSKTLLGPLSPYTWALTYTHNRDVFFTDLTSVSSIQVYINYKNYQMSFQTACSFSMWWRKTAIFTVSLVPFDTDALAFFFKYISLWHPELSFLSDNIPSVMFCITFVSGSSSFLSAVMNCPFSVIMVPVLCACQVQYYDNWRLTVPTRDWTSVDSSLWAGDWCWNRIVPFDQCV